MTGWVAIVSWAACRQVDPDLQAQARAVARWEAGRDALGAGDAAEALVQFRAAREIRPSPLLDAWEARALAAGGSASDLEAAVARLEAVVAARPMFAAARYNLAAYLLRLDELAPSPGRVERAGAELQQALADDDALQPRAVLDDPDFARVVDHPAFAFLPRRVLTAEVVAPPDTAFWGAEVPLRLTVGGTDGPLSVSAERAEGPLELVSVVEDAGEDRVEIVWTWRVVGEGAAEVGPLTVRAGDRSVTADGMRLRASAPPGRAAPSRSLTVVAPSELLDRVPARSAQVVDGAVVARGQVGDRVEPGADGEVPAKYELRVRGVPREVLWRWSAAAPGMVRILDGSGTEVFAGAPGVQ